MATVGKLAMSRFEISQVDLVSLATRNALQCDQIGKRADWGFDPIYATSLGSGQEIREGHSCHILSQQVEVAMWSGQVNRPAANNAAFG